MDNEKIKHDLALQYAKVKLTKFEIDKREAPMCGNTQMENEEISYLRNAYDFAISKLN